MRSELEKEIKKYLKEIKYLLPADGRTKKKFLSGLESAIYEYASDKENFTMPDIIERFGTTTEVAKVFIDCADIKDIRRRLSIKKLICAAVVAALLLGAGAFAAFRAAADFADTEKGYTVEYDYSAQANTTQARQD